MNTRATTCRSPFLPPPSLLLALRFAPHTEHLLALQETVKDGNILRGWDGYLGKQASSGAIRRINRFREADRMFSASSVTSGEKSTFAAKASSSSRRACPSHPRPQATRNTSPPFCRALACTGRAWREHGRLWQD